MFCRSLTRCGDQYKFQSRGEVFIKGKGLLRTYFLLSNGQTKIKEPPKEDFERKISDIHNGEKSSNRISKDSLTTTKQQKQKLKGDEICTGTGDNAEQSNLCISTRKETSRACNMM